eukprot:TRINITY_DN9619_c0_g2_i1.p1 TRINITY_DN9619_c0_g2~~TRINITY_DN9619_c0_g2_i1.p1  ORF type:complete len:392 (+),score=110.33 TRINITY_DN9619_c0_g2_i1:86-1261(+)
MGGPGMNPYASNRHADVLCEDPVDEAAKIRLVEEVKNRAKGAFAQKDMPSAELLYGKAISVLDTLPGKQEATLYSNRAMVRLNLNKVEDALSDAKKCLELDPSSVKAHYRKAQALQRLSEWDDAIAAAEAGLKVDPANKTFTELIDKVNQEKEKDIEDKKRLKSDAQDVRVELHNASTARAPPKKAPSAEGDSSMKGYKIRADGKKTSYFHTDISDEAKKLIEEQGFGKPKKIDAPIEESTAKGGGSQWNQAGTYEEKGMTKWLDENLKQNLVGIKFDLPTGAGSISTTGIANRSGDASISVSRGKRRHLMDVAFEVEFSIQVGDASGSGKICYSEVGTDGDDPEVKVEMNSDAPPATREAFGGFVKPAGQGLQPLVTEEVKKLIKKYMEC